MRVQRWHRKPCCFNVIHKGVETGDRSRVPLHGGEKRLDGAAAVSCGTGSDGRNIVDIVGWGF